MSLEDSNDCEEKQLVVFMMARQESNTAGLTLRFLREITTETVVMH